MDKHRIKATFDSKTRYFVYRTIHRDTKIDSIGPRQVRESRRVVGGPIRDEPIDISKVADPKKMDPVDKMLRPGSGFNGELMVIHGGY